jgi:formate dehydrogenase subunit delta
VTNDKLEKLARMANQVGDFYAALPVDEATAGAVSHLRPYWTPKMIRELVGFVDDGHARLNPTTPHAVEALAKSLHWRQLRSISPASVFQRLIFSRLPDDQNEPYSVGAKSAFGNRC